VQERDLDRLTLPQLRELRTTVDQLIQEKTDQATSELREQIAKRAEELGLDVERVFQQLSSAGTKRHVDTRWLREGKPETDDQEEAEGTREVPEPREREADLERRGEATGMDQRAPRPGEDARRTRNLSRHEEPVRKNFPRCVSTCFHFSLLTAQFRKPIF